MSYRRAILQGNADPALAVAGGRVRPPGDLPGLISMIDERNPTNGPREGAESVHTQALAEVVSNLRRRAYRVHGGTAAFAFVTFASTISLLAGWVLASGGPGWIRPVVGVLLALAAAAAAIVCWRLAGAPSDAALARRLESRDPAAAGLTTAVELSEKLTLPDAPPFSRELARAHVAAAAQRVSRTGPAAAFDERPLKWTGLSAALSVAAVLAAFVFGGPLPKGLSHLALGRAAGDASRLKPNVAPITGDISLTYVYPAHTGLQSKTVEGTNGEITAPAGTRVHIETRADRDLARAFLDLAGDSLALEVKGRQLQGTLLVQRSGSYAFRFVDARGRDLARGPEIPIVMVEDGIPTVDITAPVAEITVTEKDSVEVHFEATDDYGVAKVELVYQVGGEPEQTVSVASFGEVRKRVEGRHLWELSTLSLRPGDVVTYFLRVADNDAVGGAKQGQSRTQSLKIFSEAEHRRELVAKVEEAWEQMVLALGDRITPREGPRKVSGAARIEAGAPVDEQVLQVGSTLADVAAELRLDEKAPQELALALINVSQGLLEKGRTTRSARARARSVPSQHLGALDRAEGAEQAELEKSVLYLEALLDRQRILQIEELAREMAASRRELANLMEDFREAPTDEARGKIQREMARLRQRMTELMQRMAELSKGLQDEHLNAEALEQLAKERDLMGELDEIQKLLGEGKIDEALAKLQELGMKMDEMAQALSEAADRQAENDPALRELARDLQAFEQNLEDLRRDQQQLVEATEQLHREQTRALEEQLGREGQKLVDELRKKVEDAQASLEKVPEAQISLRFGDDLAGAKERLDDLDRALSVKDFDTALESAAQAQAHVEALEANLERENAWARRLGTQGDPAMGQAQAEASQAAPKVREVKQKLEELFSNPSQRLSAEQRQQLQRMEQRQREIAQQMDQLKEQAQRIGDQAPIFDESAKQAMEGARGSMGEAADRLAGREPGGALSAERRAGEQLQSLQQGLEQAKKQAKGNKGGSGFPLPFASGGGRGDGSGQGDFDAKEKVAIPSADQYRAPEEFRKDILDAMKQDAPAPFKEHVREYYEEIVK